MCRPKHCYLQFLALMSVHVSCLIDNSSFIYMHRYPCSSAYAQQGKGSEIAHRTTSDLRTPMACLAILLCYEYAEQALHSALAAHSDAFTPNANNTFKSSLLNNTFKSDFVYCRMLAKKLETIHINIYISLNDQYVRCDAPCTVCAMPLAPSARRHLRRN